MSEMDEYFEEGFINLPQNFNVPIKGIEGIEINITIDEFKEIINKNIKQFTDDTIDYIQKINGEDGYTHYLYNSSSKSIRLIKDIAYKLAVCHFIEDFFFASYANRILEMVLSVKSFDEMINHYDFQLWCENNYSAIFSGIYGINYNNYLSSEERDIEKIIASSSFLTFHKILKEFYLYSHCKTYCRRDVTRIIFNFL